MTELTEKLRFLEEIVLMPRASFGFQVRNNRNGKTSGTQNVSVSLSITLWKMLVAVIGAGAAIYGAICLCRMRMKQKIRKGYREKLKKWKKKMAIS